MSKPQVVIMRKDKRIRHPFLHATAFALTGGLSGVVTAAEAANRASYNRQTRALQAESEGLPVTPAQKKQALQARNSKLRHQFTSKMFDIPHCKRCGLEALAECHL